MCCVGNDNDLREVTLGRERRLRRHEEGRGVRRPHHRVGRDRARALRRGEEARLRLRRRAGVRRPGRRRERRAHRDVRRRRRALRARREGDRRLCAHVQAARPAGSGQLTKMVNQICIAGLVQGLAEGIHFAKKAGLDVEAVIETISKGAAQSWQMENRYKTMNAGKFDFGFAVDWMRKDLSICLGEARKNGAEPAGRRAGRPVLCRGAEDGRQALGHVEPDRAAGAVDHQLSLRGAASGLRSDPDFMVERIASTQRSQCVSWHRSELDHQAVLGDEQPGRPHLVGARACSGSCA